MKVIVRMVVALATVIGLFITVPGTASASARCDHGTHTHPHNGHIDTWVFVSHAGTNPHVHLFRNITHNVYDVANC
jgi:hypothetical protein